MVVLSMGLCATVNLPYFRTIQKYHYQEGKPAKKKAEAA